MPRDDHNTNSGTIPDRIVLCPSKVKNNLCRVSTAISSDTLKKLPRLMQQLRPPQAATGPKLSSPSRLTGERSPHRFCSGPAVVVTDHLLEVVQFGLQIFTPALLHLIICRLWGGGGGVIERCIRKKQIRPIRWLVMCWTVLWWHCHVKSFYILLRTKCTFLVFFILVYSSKASC